MGLRAEAIAAKPTNPAAECRIAQVLRALPVEDADDLRAMLVERTVDDARYAFSADTIAKVVSTRNIALGSNSVERHRRGTCRCP